MALLSLSLFLGISQYIRTEDEKKNDTRFNDVMRERERERERKFRLE